VCKERGISYATFTLVDIEPNSLVRIMEYDNPVYLLIRQNTVIEPARSCTTIERKNRRTAPSREERVSYSDFKARTGDRLVLFSDGVTKSGMGSPACPMGWGFSDVQDYVMQAIEESPEISARELARKIVQKALAHDGYIAKDDITCGVIYFRHPRDLLVLSGPPVNPEHNGDMARIFREFERRKILCGGTTATIVS
jgi:hypothetical protein